MRFACLAGLFAALLCSAATDSAAQSLTLTTKSIYHAYEIQLLNGSGANRNLNRFYQTLDVGGWNLISGPGNVNVVASLRYDTDFGTGFRLDTPDGAGIPAVGGRNDLDLRYLYVEWNGLLGRRLDVRLGRQLLLDDLDWYVIDGLKVTGHIWQQGENSARVEAYLGLPVQYDRLFASEPLLNDGVQVDDRPNPFGGLAFGGAVFVRLFRNLSISSAFRQEMIFRGDDLEAFRGFDAGAQASAGKIGIQERMIGASVGYTIRPLKTDIYGKFNWNLLVGALDQARAGISVNPFYGLHFGAEYLRVRPRFAGDSIFNFFNIFPYDRGRLEADWEIIKGLKLQAGYFLQIFNGGEKGPFGGGATSPNEGLEFTGSDLSHGPSGGLQYQQRLFTVGAFGEASTNTGGEYAYGGNYRLFYIFGQLRLFENRLGTSLRLSMTDFQNDWFEGVVDGEVQSPQRSFALNIGVRGQILSFLSARVNFIKNFSSVLEGSYRIYSELAFTY